MHNAARTDRYLDEVAERLKHDGFSIEHEVRHKGTVFKQVAKRNRFAAEFFGFAMRFVFVFAELPRIDRESFKAFSKKSFCYASSVRGVPLPRGLYCGVVCFPVAIQDALDVDFASSIRHGNLPKHWCAFEMPVVCDVSASQLYYSERTPMWGSAYYPLLRQMIHETLSP